MIKMFRIFERGGRLPVVGSALLCGLLVSCKPAENQRVQGYVEGEFVYVASPLAGALETLSVQRGTLTLGSTAGLAFTSGSDASRPPPITSSIRAGPTLSLAAAGRPTTRKLSRSRWSSGTTYVRARFPGANEVKKRSPAGGVNVTSARERGAVTNSARPVQNTPVSKR